MDLALNIGFGVIGVVSFIYAIWQNRSARAAAELTTRITANIQRLAREIMLESTGTPSMAYAKSIVEISDSLVSSKSEAPQPKLGGFHMTFLTPQFRSRLAKISSAEDSKFGMQLSAAFDGEAWSASDLESDRRADILLKTALAYGPYIKLPVSGRYRVDFRLKRADVQTLSSNSLVLLDAYCLTTDRQYSMRELNSRTISRNWEMFSLEFLYNDPEKEIEFRVLIMEPGIKISFDHVVVELVVSF